jgi:cytochrome P450
LRIRTPAPLKPFKRHTAVVILHLRMLARAVVRSARLPPGRLDPDETGMHTDRLFAIKKAKELGPVFKAIWGGRYTTCVVGHTHARRLLASNENSFPDATIDLTGLFPIGALRGMTGESHQKYRRLFVQALQATPLALHEAAIRQWILERLRAMVPPGPASTIAGPALRAGLREITSGIMMRMIYGIAPDSPDYAELLREYRIFGPDAPVRKIEPVHAEAFARIKQKVQKFAEEIRRAPPESVPPSFLKYLVGSGELDETALGNLMYLFEPSHFDLYSLWRWIVRFLAAHPQTVTRGQGAAGGQLEELCKAIVLETLRLEQSEVLYRTPVNNVVFENKLIPKGTIMRACMWEGHKDPSIFADPFAFDPDRFIGKSYKIEQYAPFGLDKTRCVGADFVVNLGAIFVEILLKNFAIALVKDGPPVFGAYHWEPNPEFSMVMKVREESRPDVVPA